MLIFYRNEVERVGECQEEIGFEVGLMPSEKMEVRVETLRHTQSQSELLKQSNAAKTSQVVPLGEEELDWLGAEGRSTCRLLFPTPVVPEC